MGGCGAKSRIIQEPVRIKTKMISPLIPIKPAYSFSSNPEPSSTTEQNVNMQKSSNSKNRKSKSIFMSPAISSEIGQPETMVSYMKGHLIDKGSHWEVFQCLDPQTGQLYAMKTMRNLQSKRSLSSNGGSATSPSSKGIFSAAILEQLRSEITKFGRFSHHNVVRYISLDASESARLNIILEFVSGGSIRAMLEKFGAFNEKVVSLYMRQVLNGLQYLHNQKVCHRDIKGGNILIDTDGTIKLTGFGSIASLLVSHIPPYWTAPEVLANPDYGFQKSADIWSLGCLVIEMLTGAPPYSNQFPQNYKSQTRLAKHIIKGNLPEWPITVSQPCQEFLTKTLQFNPTDRATLEDLMDLAFINADPESLENIGDQSPHSGTLQKSQLDFDSKPSITRSTAKKLSKQLAQNPFIVTTTTSNSQSKNIEAAAGNFMQARDLYQSSLILQLKDSNAAANILQNNLTQVTPPVTKQQDQRDVENEILALVRKKKKERNNQFLKSMNILPDDLKQENQVFPIESQADNINERQEDLPENEQQKPTTNNNNNNTNINKQIKVIFNNPNDRFTPLQEEDIFKHNSHLLNQQYNDLDGMIIPTTITEHISRSFRILSMKRIESSRIDEAEEREEQEIDDSDRSEKKDTRSSLLRTRGRSAIHLDRKHSIIRGGSHSSVGNSFRTSFFIQQPPPQREGSEESYISHKPILLLSVPSMSSFSGIDRLQGSQQEFIGVLKGGFDMKFPPLKKQSTTTTATAAAAAAKTTTTVMNSQNNGNNIVKSERITQIRKLSYKFQQGSTEIANQKKATFSSSSSYESSTYLSKAKEIKEFVKVQREIPKLKTIKVSSQQLPVFPDLTLSPKRVSFKHNRVQSGQTTLFRIEPIHHPAQVS